MEVVTALISKFGGKFWTKGKRKRDVGSKATRQLKRSDVRCRYAEAAEIGCSRSFTSCDGTGYRTDKHIPHGCRPGGFCEKAGGFVPGGEPCCLCMVSFIESFSFIGSNGPPTYFKEHEEACYGVCGQF